MRIQHKPGDAIQVDWAGNTLPAYDSVTGEQSPAYLFVTMLPCSCYTYAEACENMKAENWLACHIHAFQYFGGVTQLLISDNCKTATTANTRYETVLNHSCQELAEYYGTTIVPAASASLRTKAQRGCLYVSRKHGSPRCRARGSSSQLVSSYQLNRSQRFKSSY